jgi:3-isopropylmalate/(R)-2-methylmalate dehydratase small subunit
VQPFITHTGRGVVLNRADVDTDQIIPAEYLKRITRTGFGDGLFAAWRGPDFPLDQPERAGASILITGPNFGCGSSREHAVWAIQDGGFRALIGPSFADIFNGNALGNGLLPVALPADTVAAIAAAVEADPQLEITVDLQACTVTAGTVSASFSIDDGVRLRLLEGLDEIGVTLQDEQMITTYEAGRRAYLPSL